MTYPLHRSNSSLSLCRIAPLCLLTLIAVLPVRAQTLTPLYSFVGGALGSLPNGLSIDQVGNLYGVTENGGSPVCGYGLGCGTVFELRRTGSAWTFHSLYAFHGSDGQSPNARPVIGPTGALFGTTISGGPSCFSPGDSCGVAYQLRPPPTPCKTTACSWKETVLTDFNLSLGTDPYAAVTFDQSGNLYGTAQQGGLGCDGYGCGTVYMLSPENGGWNASVIAYMDEYAYPYWAVLLDSAGNIYGTSGNLLFELTPTGSGWSQSAPHYFGGSDGSYPGELIWDSAGNIYGVTTSGGAHNVGTAFKLTRSNGGWTFSKIYDFSGAYGPDGFLTIDAAGNLYGAKTHAGPLNFGTVFKLSPSQGTWTETQLHFFGGQGDGSWPTGKMQVDPEGNLYGTSSNGGAQGGGVVWEITQ